MNNSIEFIKKVISEPSFLTLNRSVDLKLAVTYLSRYGHDGNPGLLKNVVEELYSRLDESDRRDFDYDATTTCFSFENLKKMLESDKLLNSNSQNETLDLIINIYKRESTIENPLYGLIMFVLDPIQKQTEYLVVEEFQDYFLSDRSHATEEEQMVYCLHVLNAWFLHFDQKNDLKFKQDNAITMKDNLLAIMRNENAYITRFAIWALGAIVGIFRKQDSLITLSLQELDYLSAHLSQNIDNRTIYRILFILIKCNPEVFKLIKEGDELTRVWLRDLTNSKRNISEAPKPVFQYAELVQEKLLPSLTEENQVWLNHLIIPYLGTMATESAIPILIDNLNLKSNMTLKITSAIILNGLGFLTEDLIKEQGLNLHDFKDQVNNRYTRSSGHLIHKLKAKDTTGRWAYYFILVNEEKEADFLKAIEGDDTIDLEDYGKVIASCYGEKPTDEVKDYLKDKYGFNI